MINEHLTFFRVGLPDEVVALLIEMAEHCHSDPAVVAAALLRDILIEDAREHLVQPQTPAAARLN